jgi:hypothetical protein
MSTGPQQSASGFSQYGAAKGHPDAGSKKHDAGSN